MAEAEDNLHIEKSKLIKIKFFAAYIIIYGRFVMFITAVCVLFFVESS